LTRTVCLGLIFLVGLVSLALLKFALGTARPVFASETTAATTNGQGTAIISTDAAPNTPAKADRLPLTALAPAVAPVSVVNAPASPEPTEPIAPNITSRHWHDPSDKKGRSSFREEV
jgi:hypothetical protein